MKKILLSVLLLSGMSVIAQEKLVQFNAHTLAGETVVFEGVDVNSGELVQTRPYLLSELESAALTSNGNNVRYWLFEGCYKYETAITTDLSKFTRVVLSGHSGGWSFWGDDNGEFSSKAHEAAHVVQQSGKVEIYQAKEWVKPCPSHVTN